MTTDTIARINEQFWHVIKDSIKTIDNYLFIINNYLNWNTVYWAFRKVESNQHTSRKVRSGDCIQAQKEEIQRKLNTVSQTLFHAVSCDS